MIKSVNQRWHVMYDISLVFAPLLQALSTFFWVQGEYGNRWYYSCFFMIFWIPALIALFSLVKDKLPNYAEWGLLIAIYGFVSGVNFAFTGVFAEVFSISHDQYIAEFSKHPVSSNLLLFQAGPLAPLSLIILGIVFMYTRATDWKIGLLILLGGITFPFSRISRIEWAAHTSDNLLLIPMSILSWKIMVQGRIN